MKDLSLFAGAKLNDYDRTMTLFQQGAYWLTREFHTRFGFAVNSQVQLNPSVTDRERRLRLILEEFKELCDAMGFDLIAEGETGECISVFESLTVEHQEGSRYDPVETADALGDINVVVAGTAIELGIPQPIIDMEIYLSNMTKLGEDGYCIFNGITPGYREGELGYRADAPVGKGLKGPNYVPPNVARIIHDHIGSESK